MNRANRSFAGIVLGIVICAVAMPRAAMAQEKPAAKKRPHTDSGTPFVHRIQLRDETDNPISVPKTGTDEERQAKIKFASVTNTCGKCHDYPTISAGWHFNAATPGVDAGRPGEPWILTDDGVLEDLKNGQAATRTQLPVSYRGWVGTFKPSEVGGLNDWKFAYTFGRHFPGGGIFESSPDQRFNVTGHLQNDCLMCHLTDNSYDGNARYEQIFKLQNFKYATLVAAGVGSAEKSREKLKDTWIAPDPNDKNADGPPEPKFEYNLARFDPQGHVTFNVSRRVPNERCLYCHTSIDTGRPQTNDLKERWRHDRDIHLVKGMMCVDCHQHGLDHQVTRGYEGEDKVRNDPAIATLSCRGCHFGNSDPKSVGTDRGGRNAAPHPQHKGLPTLHFDKLSCTACHSGPYPGPEATSVLTSMAHRLGVESFNRVDDAAPAIQEPVFLRDGGTGKITPHKVLYPTFWGRLNGDTISPLAPDLLNTSSALRKTFGSKPANDGQPLAPLKEEEIVKVLTAIAAMEPPAPKASDKPTTTPATTAATAPVTPPWYTGEPVFVTGGKAYKRDGTKLVSFNSDEASPYAWPLAHDVRGAQQALGARGCTDCHKSGAPIFDSKVSSSSLLVGASGSSTMHELREDSMGALEAMATSYAMRPLLIGIGYACAVVLVLLLITYGGRAAGRWGSRFANR